MENLYLKALSVFYKSLVITINDSDGKVSLSTKMLYNEIKLEDEIRTIGKYISKNDFIFIAGVTFGIALQLTEDKYTDELVQFKYFIDSVVEEDIECKI